MPLSRVRGGVFGPILRMRLLAIAVCGLTAASANYGARFGLLETDRRSNWVAAHFPEPFLTFRNALNGSWPLCKWEWQS